MKNFSLILALSIACITLPALAQNPNRPSVPEIQRFEIPRSMVVEIEDPESQRSYPIFIKLPKSYKKKSTKKYPVIYMTDAWYTFQIVSGAMRLPTNTGNMDEAIIVGISYSNEAKGAASRNRDYTPTRDKDWKGLTGEARQHSKFIKEEVFEYIESNFKASPKNRSYAGISFGALLGTYILMTDTKMFQNYILVSPSYWWDNKYIFDLEVSFAERMKNERANVFLAIGEFEKVKYGSKHDMVKDAELFYKRMLTWPSSNINLNYQLIPKAYHNTVFPAAATQGLLWLFGNCEQEGVCL